MDASGKIYQYISEIISDSIKKGEVNGVSVYGEQNGNVLINGRFGYADKEKKLLISDDTIYRIFSMTKPVTAAAAMILLERGKLRYTDEIRKFFPEYENMNVISEDGTLSPAERNITVRDLLSMTSGIVYPEETPAGRIMGQIFYETQKNSLTTEEIARKIGKCPLMFSPGEMWRYGASADVLGAVVEKISDKSLGEFMRDEIFTPLEMNNTGFYIKEENSRNLAVTYEETENGLEPYTGTYLCITDMKTPPPFESGGAGLCSTLSDYRNFAKFLLTGKSPAGETILGKNTLNLMRKNMLNENQKKYAHEWDSLKGHGYGCFMRILEDTTQTGINSAEGEFGWDGWTGNYFSCDPVNNAVFLFFIQKTNAGTTELLLRTKNIFYSAIE